MTSKNEQTNKRLMNQNAILKVLHYEGQMQRGEISTLCGIRKSSVTSIAATLIKSGVLYEVDPGRYRSPIALNTSNRITLVASINPRNITFAYVDMAGNMIEQKRISTDHDDSPDSIINHLSLNLKQMMIETSNKSLGVGVALPGIIDPDKGRCIQAVNLNMWQNIPLGQILSEKLNTTVLVDNDVRCQLHACTWFDRMARNAENILYILLHDGVSCALMSRGQIIIGERFTAGEVGHTKAGEEARLCACGRTDCLETYCSLPAIIAEINSIRPNLKLQTATDVAKAAATTPAIDNVLNRIAHRLALSLTGIVAATDPAALVLATADQSLTNCLRPHLQRHLYSEMLGMQTTEAKIITADNAEKGTLRGIAAQVVQRSFQNGSLSARHLSSLPLTHQQSMLSP